MSLLSLHYLSLWLIFYPIISNFLCSSCLLRLGKIFCLRICLDVDTKMFMLTAGYEEQWCETVSTAHKIFIEQFAFLSLKAGSIKA